LITSSIWNIGDDSSNQQLHIDFVETIANTNYKNFEKLQRFANEPHFTNADFLMIARKMKSNIQLVNADFTHVTTEVCATKKISVMYDRLNIFADGNVSEFIKVLLPSESFF
jgi:hypothetical protein